MTGGSPRTIALLAALVAAHLAATLWLTPRGHLNVDECTYHVMAEAAQSGSLAFENGYAEFASPELVWASMVPHDGALYPITPPFYALVAWPFEHALGLSGLFWMNALAWLGVLWLTGVLAQQLFGERRLALTAVLVLALATYLWEYSQGAWAHVLATLAVVAALSLSWRGANAASQGAAWRACALAGLVLGLGVGIRLDVVLAAPALALPCLLAPSWRWRRLLALGLGGLLPLLGLTFINYLKFGVAFPFSYGPLISEAGDWTQYLPLVGLGAAAGLLAFGCGYAPVRRALRKRPAAALGAAVLTGAGLLALPELRELFARLFSGVWVLLVDLRELRSDLVRPALSRSSGGGLVYYGHLKKAWLQSLPYLGLLLVPLLAVLRRHADSTRLASLLLLPATTLGVFGYFTWDGGLSLNLRYLTPALPAVAILVAWTLRSLDVRATLPALGVGAWCAAAVFWLLARTHGASPDTAERTVLDAPLILASVTALAVLAWLATRTRASQILTCACAGAGLTWAALTAFAYDYPGAHWLRGYHAELSRIARERIEPDSILFTTHPDPFCGMIEAEGVRIALPARDGYADFRELAAFHADAGRAVYAALPRGEWQRLEREGELAGFEVERVHEHPIFLIGRLRD